jgi:tRNA pseudouridine65 synthase
VCDSILPIPIRTRVVLVMHTREARKCAATGPFALTALNDCALQLYGKRDQALDLHHLHADGRRVLVLYPNEAARLLTPQLAREDPRPLTLVVPDGSWRQARRAAERVPGLDTAEVVKLPGPELDTFVALTRALGILESPAVEQQLNALATHRLELSAHLEPAPTRPHAHSRGGDSSTDQQPLSILHRDEHLLAINKPSGMLVHRGWGKDGAIALQLLRDQVGQRVHPLHRLDRATSGALLFALSSEVARDMQELFAGGAVHKRYLAVCRGNTLEDGRLCHALSQKQSTTPKPAITDFRLLGAFERYGLVEAKPITGKTHQIRRHLKHLAHPIIGDVRYGKSEHNRIFRERFGFHRLALHCQRLEFPHPRGGAALNIEAPLPADFAALLERLGLSRELRSVPGAAVR